MSSTTITIDGYTVQKVREFSGRDSYIYRDIRVWRTTERASALSNGAGWKFNFGTRELIGGATQPKVHWNKTRAQAFAEIDALLDGGTR